MKTKYTSPIHSAGFALLWVMIMCAISLIIMAGIVNRTMTISKLNASNNKYSLSCLAAQAATEKVFDRMAYDFQTASAGMITNNYVNGLYATNIPTTGENSYWGNFVFSDACGNTGKVYVTYLTNYAGAMPSQYTNLYTKIAPIYRIVANASMVGFPGIVGTAQEDILFALLPIDTYAIFYNGPLEFTWCATMVVNGRTHANDAIYTGTSASLDFYGMVTCTKTISSPVLDGVTGTLSLNQNTTFHAGYATNVTAVLVGFSMTNSHSIIDLPPAGEDVNSAQGQIRLYNQAQVQLFVTNLPVAGQPPTPQVKFVLQTAIPLPADDTTKANSTYTYIWTNYIVSNTVSHLLGPTNGIFTNLSIISWTNCPHGIESFLSLTNTFTDKREYKTNMYVTQINVGAYANWLGTNGFFFIGTNYVPNKFTSANTPPAIMYVADQRCPLSNVGTNKLAVVRLVNAATLPTNTPSGGAQPEGWTLATPNPLYLLDDYNVTLDGTHFAYAQFSTTNTPSCTVPSALICDAITILSSNFKDYTSSNTIGTASANTVNAAIICGNVPSTSTTASTFSGGVHNLMRMQENWSGVNLTLNTSIVCLWASQMATNQFRNPTGFTPTPINPYYSPPNRLWGFDQNFANPAKNPQGVPTALVPIRFNWTVPPPGSVTNNLNNLW